MIQSHIVIDHKPDINVRQQDIIRELLEAHGKITFAELAEKTGLNARIIRYNMNIVRTWLQTSDIEFINKPGYGVEDLLEAINTLDDCDLVLSRKQRIRIMLLYLLTSNEPVAAKRVSEMENFSRSTIFKDIQGVERWLCRFEIKLLK